MDAGRYISGSVVPHCLTPGGRIAHRGQTIIYEPIVQVLLREYSVINQGRSLLLLPSPAPNHSFPKCRISAKTGTHLPASDTAHAHPMLIPRSFLGISHSFGTWGCSSPPNPRDLHFSQDLGPYLASPEYRRTRPSGVRPLERGDDRTRQAAGAKSRNTIARLFGIPVPNILWPSRY